MKEEGGSGGAARAGLLGCKESKASASSAMRLLWVGLGEVEKGDIAGCRSAGGMWEHSGDTYMYMYV